MHGGDIGTLQVYTKSSANPDTKLSAWSKQGNKGNTWQEARVNIFASNGQKVHHLRMLTIICVFSWSSFPFFIHDVTSEFFH